MPYWSSIFGDEASFSIAEGPSSSRNHIPTLVTPSITSPIAVTMGGGGTNMTNFKHMHERTLMYAHVFLVGPNDPYRRGALTRLILRQRRVSIAMLSIMPILHPHLHAPICKLFSRFLGSSLLLNVLHAFCVHVLKSLHGLGYVQKDLLGAGVLVVFLHHQLGLLCVYPRVCGNYLAVLFIPLVFQLLLSALC